MSQLRFCSKFELCSGFLLGNWFSLKIFKTDRRSNNKSMVIIQSRIKCKSDLNTMKTQNTRSRREKSTLSSKIKSCRITQVLRQPRWTKKIFGIWKKMQEMSWIRQLHKFRKQQQSVATSGKLFRGGKFGVAVTNKYTTSLKGKETFIKRTTAYK